MANENDVKIGIQTTADTSGVDQTTEAIAKLTAEEQRLVDLKSQFLTAAEAKVAEVHRMAESARAARAALDAVDASPGVDDIPREAKAAAGSIDALEEKVRDLTRELNRLPVGSKEFTAMAAKVKAANAEMQTAELTARKLGTTVGRGGNSGLAVLEFSRAFEDAQYGIRGVLNNIPGLIAMLGGSAGLAGAISVAAVAGTQLWERFGSGAKDATKETKSVLDLVKELKSVYQEISEAGRVDREEAAKDRADGLKADLAANSRNLKLTLDATDLDTAREKAAAVLQLAKDKLELSRVEYQLITASGEDAVRLAREREVIVQRIYQDELAITEIQRNAALTKTAAKAAEAFNNAAATTEEANALEAQFAALQETVNALRADSDALLKERLKLVTEINETQERIKKINAGLSIFDAGEEGRAKRIEVGNLEKKVVELEKRLTVSESNVTDKIAQGDTEEALLIDLKPELEKATDAQSAAAEAQLQAVEALKNLRESQAIERQSERDLKQVSDQQQRDQEIAKQKGGAVDQLGGLLDAVGESGGKDLAPFVAELKGILQDKAISADELGRLPVLLNQYFAKIANLGTAQNETVRAAMSRVDELERDIRNLKATASHRNP